MRSTPMPMPPSGAAVFKRGAEILIDHHGLVIALGALLRLLYKAAALIDWVIQLGKRICVFMAGDEQLKALRKAGAAGLRLLSGEISTG